MGTVQRSPNADSCLQCNEHGKGRHQDGFEKSSDTLYSIAREYGVTIKELMEWNQKKDFSLTVGEKLRIVKKQ